MVSFDGVVQGTSEKEWSTCAWLRDASELETITAASIVVLAAHPDDETLGAGGLIAQAADSGINVYVIIASDGAASHPTSPTHTELQLATRRKAEAIQALLDLAPDATVEFLELPDGRLADYGATIEAAVNCACQHGALLISVWARDRHPDHEACGQAARRVTKRRPDVDLREYPIWAWHWGSPATPFAADDPAVASIARLVLGPALRRRKQSAVARYVSQIGPLSSLDGDEAVLTASTLQYFARDGELFLTVRPDRG